MWFSSQLLKWYNTNKRELPWRQTRDPYHIWISEILLQQTRVNQGLPYYERFIQRFPNVHDLANAEEKEVLKAWQGLGYYSRARNLHHTAKVISSELGGVFPSSHDELIRLKGIGAYTAAAISSICFDEAKPVVDGNVYRVLSRFYGIDNPIDSAIGKKRFSDLAIKAMGQSPAGDYNQGIMEFGALYCKPSNPDCNNCILKSRCIARKNDLVGTLPIKSKKVKVRNRYFNYIVINGDKGSFFQIRSEKDIWQNLYEPLLIESARHLGKTEIIASEQWRRIFGKKHSTNLVASGNIDHKLTHQNIRARFWKSQVNSAEIPFNSSLKEIGADELSELPIPRLIEKYLELQS